MTIILRNPSNDPVPNRLYNDAAVPGVSVIRHNGNDYGWGGGREVYAAAAGRVSAVRWAANTKLDNRRGGYGNYIIIDHGNGYQTLYAHLPNTPMSVTRGQHVAVGERIGTMGNSGNASGVHLHFMLLINGRAIDPNPHIRQASSAALNTTTISPEEDTMQHLITVIFDQGAPSPAFASTAIIHPTTGWVKTSDGYGDRGALTAWVAIGRALGMTVTETHVDANGWILAQLFQDAPNATVVGGTEKVDYAALAKAVNDDAARRLAA